jgi:histidinol-phosphate/aromatic aminotransferase/cobyric acid decarboxylase-like protein
MSDIVERLRRIRTDWNRETVNDAVAEIERLREVESKGKILDGMWVHAEEEVERLQAALREVEKTLRHGGNPAPFTHCLAIIDAALAGKGET